MRATAADWTEDSHLENGNYTSLCAICGYSFVGHKRRYVCKRCSTVKNNKHSYIKGTTIGAIIGAIIGALYWAWSQV